MFDPTTSVPSVHDQMSDAGAPMMSVPHETQIGCWVSFNLAALLEQEYRSTHCEECGGITPGTVVAGVHVQRCDGCLRAALLQTIALIDSRHAA